MRAPARRAHAEGAIREREPIAPEPDTMAARVEEFLTSRAPDQRDVARAVLAWSMGGVESFADFVDGSWILGAPIRVADAADVPGYRAARVFQLLASFVAWLHGVGDLDGWQRQHLEHAIDEARSCHGLRRDRPAARGLERPPARSELPRIGEAFARTRSIPMERDLAASTVRLIASHVDAQLGGSGRSVPFGALDVRAFTDACMRELHDDPEAACCLFTLGAAFYRWLGDEGRLDRERATSQAAVLAAAALGTQVALTAACG